MSKYSEEEIIAQRQAITDEAKSWIGTPFLHARNVKGAGADCQTIITQPFANVFKTVIQVPQYSSQWHLHGGNDGNIRELYIDYLLINNCIEISGGSTSVEPFDEENFIKASIKPGDIVLAQLGRTYCHGAIIIEWPKIVQAEAKVCGRGSVQLANVNANWYMSGRKKRFFSWKDWHI